MDRIPPTLADCGGLEGLRKRFRNVIIKAGYVNGVDRILDEHFDKCHDKVVQDLRGFVEMLEEYEERNP